MDKKSRVLSVVRDSRNIKKPKFVVSCLELYAPRKFVVEPPEHRKLDTGIKITFPEDFLKVSPLHLKKPRVNTVKRTRVENV